MALTIIEPAVETKLTTVAAVKAELQVSTGADDAYLTTLIDQASDAIRTWCKRAFAVETVRDNPPRRAWPSAHAVALAGGRDHIQHRQRHRRGRSELRSRRQRSTALAGFSGYRASWPSGRIVVEYRAGYVLPGRPGRTLPNDIERAAISLVKGSWFARNRDPMIEAKASRVLARPTISAAPSRACRRTWKAFSHPIAT